MRMGALIGAAFLCAVVGGCGSKDGEVKAADPATTSLTELENAKDVIAKLDCTQMSSGTFDVIPPNSVEAARAADWPSSPEEAANRTTTAPAYDGQLDNVELSEGTPVKFPGATNATSFFAVKPDGEIVGNIIVQEHLPDVWATAHVSICDPAP